LRQIFESSDGSVEKRADDPRSDFFEFAPELGFVPAHLRLHFDEVDYQRAVEKIRTRSAQVRNRVEHQRTGGVEDRFIVIAVKLPTTEAAARYEPAGGVGQLVWQVTKVVETDQPGVSGRCG
jgi:hypothetical protein